MVTQAKRKGNKMEYLIATALSVKTEWGEDTHTLRFVITKPNEIPLLV